MTAIDTGTEDLRAEIDSGVAVITMNRPDRRNAFSQAMVSALGAVLARVETDDAVGCVVLTGAGGAFCAGGDVKSMAAPAADRGNGAAPSLDARIHRPNQGLRERLLALAGRGPRGQRNPAWVGSAVELDHLRATAEESGLQIAHIEDPGTQYCTVLLQRR